MRARVKRPDLRQRRGGEPRGHVHWQVDRDQFGLAHRVFVQAFDR